MTASLVRLELMLPPVSKVFTRTLISINIHVCTAAAPSIVQILFGSYLLLKETSPPLHSIRTCVRSVITSLVISMQ